MIKNARDVPDLARLDHVGATQQEVVILTSLESSAETACSLKQVAAVHRQMTDVVLRRDQCGVPVGLEQRSATQSLPVELVFVAIDNCYVGMLLDFIGEPEQRLLCQFIIVI